MDLLTKGKIVTGLWYLALAVLLFFVIKHLVYLNKITKATQPVSHALK